MRFTIKREEFLKGLLTASRAVASKVVVAVLADLKIDLTENGLFITGSNNDLTIKTQIPFRFNGVEIIRNYKEGSVLVNARRITELVRRYEFDEVTIDVIDSTNIAISNGVGTSEHNWDCVRPEEYPDLDLEPIGTKLTISKADLESLVNQTAFAASTKEQKPLMTAMNLVANSGFLTAATTDASRIARKQIAIPDGVRFVANIPVKTMVEIDHLLEDQDSVEITVSDRKVWFIFGRTVVASRLIAGDYYDTKNVVDDLIKSTICTLEVNANDFVKAVERATIEAGERENVVDLSVDENSLKVFAQSHHGSGTERIDLFKFNGDNFRISFNSEYVIAAIKALNSEDVVLSFVSVMKPFLIKNPQDDSVVQVVTAMRPR